MARKYHSGEELSSIDFGFSLEEMREWSLEGFARMGAKAILETALAEEIEEFIGRRRYERGGKDNGYRNGKRKKRDLRHNRPEKNDARLLPDFPPRPPASYWFHFPGRKQDVF